MTAFSIAASTSRACARPAPAGRSSCWRSCQAPWVTTRSPGLSPLTTATWSPYSSPSVDLAALELLAGAQDVDEALALRLEHRLLAESSGTSTRSPASRRTLACCPIAQRALADSAPRRRAWRRACPDGSRRRRSISRPANSVPGAAGVLKTARVGRAEAREIALEDRHLDPHDVRVRRARGSASPGATGSPRRLGDAVDRPRDRAPAPCRSPTAAAGAARHARVSRSASRCATAAASVDSAAR